MIDGPRIPIPKVRPVWRRFDQPVVADIPDRVRDVIVHSGFRTRVPAGARVAVAVGSRGIANLKTIVRATVNTLTELGFQPFIVAGMGTHGNGLAEGQRRILADYGITEADMGVPVRVEMESVPIGISELGATVYWDRNALGADAVVAVNRVKAHTDFVGNIESGIVKMLVIGLGKRESPLQVHRLGGRGMEENIVASAKVILEKTPFQLGIAVVENAAEETALIEALEPKSLFAEEARLLVHAKEWMGRLPFEQAEVLIVGELGKNYSGAGIDPNVIGRRMIEGQADFPSPTIIRIAVLDISPESHGNAVGTGLADLTTRRLVDQIDHEMVLLNTLTARFLERSRVPLTFANDREVIQIAVDTCWEPDPDRIRMAIIPNSLELSHFYVTDALANQLNAPAGSVRVGDPMDLPFLDGDRLDQIALFPHALQGRRSRE